MDGPFQFLDFTMAPEVSRKLCDKISFFGAELRQGEIMAH